MSFGEFCIGCFEFVGLVYWILLLCWFRLGLLGICLVRLPWGLRVYCCLGCLLLDCCLGFRVGVSDYLGLVWWLLVVVVVWAAEILVWIGV